MLSRRRLRLRGWAAYEEQLSMSHDGVPDCRWSKPSSMAEALMQRDFLENAG